MERIITTLTIFHELILLSSQIILDDPNDLLYHTSYQGMLSAFSPLKTTNIHIEEDESRNKTWIDEILKEMEKSKNLNVPSENEKDKIFKKESERLAEVVAKPIQVRNDSRDFYCKKFSNCAECYESRISECKWCHVHGCVSAKSKKCTIDRKWQIDSEPCPKIFHDSHILVPSGVKTDIAVKINAPDPAIFNGYVMCQISFKNRITHLKAQIIKDTVYCYPLHLNFSNLAAGSEYGVFKLKWGGIVPYSNEVGVEVYNCDALAFDCESCRVIHKRYGCGWCEKQNSCVIDQKCKSDFMKWTISRLTCRDMKSKFVFG